MASTTDVQTPSSEWNTLGRRHKFRLYVHVATTALDGGRVADARRHVAKALKYGDSAALRRIAARTYIDAGKPWLAIHHQRRAVDLAPDDWRYLLQLGRLYLDVGQRPQACRAFLAALARNPKHRHIQEHLQRYCPPIRTQ